MLHILINAQKRLKLLTTLSASGLAVNTFWCFHTLRHALRVYGNSNIIWEIYTRNFLSSMNSQRFKEHRCKSGSFLRGGRRVTWNYAYSPFNKYIFDVNILFFVKNPTNPADSLYEAENYFNSQQQQQQQKQYKRQLRPYRTQQTVRYEQTRKQQQQSNPISLSDNYGKGYYLFFFIIK